MKRNIPAILQVEDDENDVYFLKYAFGQAGIDNPVHVARDGVQAIDYLAGTGVFGNRKIYPLPSLVLLDLKLPRKSGVEVLKWIREQPELRTVVVIVWTSWCDPADVELCYQLGANSFVGKPVDLDRRVEFAKVLKAWWLGISQFAPGPGTDSGAVGDGLVFTA